MVDTLRKTSLEDLGLQPTLQEVLNLEGQHVIETHARLVEHTNTDESTDEGVTLEETLGVLGVELEQLTGGTTNFGEDEGDAPDLALVAQAVLAGELQIMVRGDERNEVVSAPSARHRDGQTRMADGELYNCTKPAEMGRGIISTCASLPQSGS